MLKTWTAAALVGALAMGVAACGSDDNSSTGTASGGSTAAASGDSGSGGKGAKIALLLPENTFGPTVGRCNAIDYVGCYDLDWVDGGLRSFSANRIQGIGWHQPAAVLLEPR